MSDADNPRNQPETEPDSTPASVWEALFERVRTTVAPRFQVERLIGYGGMAGVYLAHEPKLGRRVAIKVMSPSLMVDPGLVKRFRQEARTIAQLDHPNIITIYDVAEDEDLQYFVMAYVPGRTVGHVMRELRGPLPVDVVQAWMYQVGSALEYAHRSGVVHRDVKPGNILLDGHGSALVTDFGIAKVADQEGLTRTGMLVGTPAYMSPEQCSSAEVGAPSDQYSLGALCYQMLTGEPPFSGPTLAVLHAHVAQRPEPVKAIRPDCPDALAEAVDRMLGKRPEDRWPNLSSALTAMGAVPVGNDAALRQRLSDLAAPVGRVTVSAPHGVRRPPTPSDHVAAGVTFVAEAIVTGADGRVLTGRRVSWTSDAPSVAVAMPEGRVVALSPGTARVTAECGGVKDSLVFRVAEAPAGDEVAVPPRELAAGASVPLAEILPGSAPSADDPDSGWGSTRPEIARITEAGDLEALRPGRATITAFRSGRAVVAELTVTPAPGQAGAGGGTRASTPVPASRAMADTPSPASAPAAEGGAGSRTAGASAAASGAKGSAATRGTSGAAATKRRTLALAAGGGLAAVLLLGAGFLLLSGDRPGDVAGGDGIQPPTSPGAVGPGTADPTPPVAVGDEGGDTADAAVGDTADPPRVAAEDETAPPAEDPPPAILPDPTGPDRPEPPREAVVRVGQLPAGARAVILVDGSEMPLEPGRQLTLPPGSYEGRVTADGYEPFEERVTLNPGDTFDWRPALRAEPAPEPDPVPPATPERDEAAEREAHAGIENLIAEFARSFETRDMEQVLQFFLEAPGGWAERWRPLIEDERNASGLRAQVRNLRDLELDGLDAGSAAFSVALEYRDFRNALQTPVLEFRAAVERRDGSWRFLTLNEGG